MVGSARSPAFVPSCGRGRGVRSVLSILQRVGEEAAPSLNSGHVVFMLCQGKHSPPTPQAAVETESD